MRALFLLGILAGLAAAPAAHAAGYEMFSTVSYSTGEKPQSKLWHHDGSYWAVLRGPDGVAFYEKVGTTWVRGTFVDAVLTSGGQADVKWNGSELFVLVYSSSSKLFKYTYSTSQRSWIKVTGFPVSVPNPSGSETMVLEQDWSGRLWTTAEGGGNINVYYSTSADHRTWTTTPIVLQTGVNTDDICSIVAFGGNKVGVFWSDQNRDQFGFRYHNDADAPETWSGIEIADSGSGHADDHVHLAFDSQGRVYAITKDDNNKMRVHRRGASGGWTTKTDVLGGTSTRGIIMVAEEDSKVYVLYTRWGVSPERIEYRVADISTLSFGGETIFISSARDMNNVTGTKQLLPRGNLIAAAENGSMCLYNSFGSPPGGGTQPPGPPQNLLATLAADRSHVDLAWSAPASGTPEGYDVYRQVDGGGFTKLNAVLVTSTLFTDNSLASGQLCYQVKAMRDGLEGSASNTACVDNIQPPGPPLGLTAQLIDTGNVPAMLSLPFDEGSGQQASDQSGNGNHGRLGTSTGVDTTDPTWVAGVAGTALQFDGSNDFVEVADAPSLDPAGSFTIETWVRRNGTSTVGLVGKGDSGERTYRLRITSAGEVEFRWEIAGGSARELVVSKLFTDTAWHHLACVYDQAAGQNRVFLDGVLRGTKAATGVPATNAKTLLVGAYLSSGSRKGFLNGALDGLRIAPEALYSADFTPPTAPVLFVPDALFAVSGPVDTPASVRVQLQWQPPATGGAAVGYNVYRSVDAAAPAKINPALITTTGFSDASPPEGELCYHVKAVNSLAVEGAASNSACLTVGPPPPPLPDAPANLTAALQGTTPESSLLQWEAPTTGTPAVGYNVYRKVGSGALQKVNSDLVAATSFTDTLLVGGTLCYEVAGVDAEAREGGHSNSACVTYTPPLPPAPSAPLDLTANYATTPGGPAIGAAAYLLDEGSGQTMADATGNGHTGQLGTAPGADTADPTWTAGKSGNALLFDGSNDRTIVADAPDLRFAGSFTLEAWVQRAATGAAHCILSKGDSQRRNFWVVLTGGNTIDFRWETSGGTNHGTTSSTTITDTAWHHVACVFDQALGQNRIYLDGALVKSSSDTGTPMTSTDALLVGTRLSSGTAKDFFKGAIDLVRVSPGVVYAANFVPPTAFGEGPPQTSVQLAWQPPASGTPAGYNVYRQVDGGIFTKLNASLVAAASYTDASPPAGALCYQVSAVDAIQQEGPPSAAACPTNLVAKSRAASPLLPAAEPSLAASPNPFNPATTIAFRIPAASRVDLAIYDVRGRRVATLVAEPRAAGEHLVRWSGRADSGESVASGTYFLLLRAGEVRLRQKLVLLK